MNIFNYLESIVFSSEEQAIRFTKHAFNYLVESEWYREFHHKKEVRRCHQSIQNHPEVLAKCKRDLVRAKKALIYRIELCESYVQNTYEAARQAGNAKVLKEVELVQSQLALMSQGKKVSPFPGVLGKIAIKIFSKDFLAEWKVRALFNKALHAADEVVGYAVLNEQYRDAVGNYLESFYKARLQCRIDECLEAICAIKMDSRNKKIVQKMYKVEEQIHLLEHDQLPWILKRKEAARKQWAKEQAKAQRTTSPAPAAAATQK